MSPSVSLIKIAKKIYKNILAERAKPKMVNNNHLLTLFTRRVSNIEYRISNKMKKLLKSIEIIIKAIKFLLNETLYKFLKTETKVLKHFYM